MNAKIPFITTLVVYSCAFLLFMEWLYPVNIIGEVNNLSLFVLYALFCFLLSLLSLKWWLTMLLKGVGLLFVVDRLFLDQVFLSRGWLLQLITEMGFNINALFSQHWYAFTPLFRSFLFLLLIWLMSYLLHYWFTIMKRILLFVLLTFVYITILDTFTAYDATAAIIRTFVISFIALGLTNFLKEVDQEEVSFSWLKKFPLWAGPLLVFVFAAAVIGYAAPKFDPQWPDPVPFIKSAAENAGGGKDAGTVKKVGYGNNDSRLGGSFVQDYTPVFQAAVENEHYWRVETKDVYTGKGWEKSRDAKYEVQQGNYVNLRTFAGRVDTTEYKTILDFKDKNFMKKLLYPYGIKRVTTPPNTELLLDHRFGEIRTQQNGQDTALNNYTITYEAPVFAIDELRKANQGDPPKLLDQYTQLPNALPERVGELAKEITADQTNRYDKASAVESYFNRNGFTYQIRNVPVPKEDQDYVDQFLFDSKKGYCDNYSTSMVVMLRTLDIPARWVKGFTSGEKIATSEEMEGYDIYEVTNANAHSWVEVYFPEQGWVPFEPTQGFSNLADFQLNTPNENNQEETPQPPEVEEPEQPEQEPEQNKAETPGETEKQTSDFTLNWWKILLGVSILGLLFLFVYITRFRWMPLYLLRKWEKNNDAKTFQDAYHYVLKLLAHKGLPKDTEQTLRDYARQIDQRYKTNAMGQLTSYYERMLYKNQPGNANAAELSQLWKNLIKQIRS